MINTPINTKKKVMTICLYYSRLRSSDKRRKNISQFYKELGVTTGINANTIRQWGDVYDALFDNGRMGYHQRPISEQNKDLEKIYNDYKDLPIEKLSKLSDDYLEELRGNESNVIEVNGLSRRVYSIKTSNDEVAEKVLSKSKKILTIERLNWFKMELHDDDIILMVLGGDRKPWINGLYAIGKITKEPYDYGYIKNNFKIDIKLELFLPEVLQSSYFYYYPNTRNVINIGPSTKGAPNQAINKVSGVGLESVIKGIIDKYSELEEDCLRIFGNENVPNSDKYIPMLKTYEENTSQHIKEDIGYDFEGNEELFDFVSINDSQKKYISEINNTSQRSYTMDLMESNQAQQKSLSNISRDSVSIFDLYRRYSRYKDTIDMANDTMSDNNINFLETGLILDPEFQRDLVWNLDKKRQLIDSILLGIPLPTFYFSEDKNGNYLVVDGKQRLSTIFDFMDNSFPLGREYRFLTKEKNSSNEVHFSDLLPRIRNKLEDFMLMCYVVASTTPDVIQNEIFVRVNRGGVPLNHQEIRNAINVGHSTALLNRISKIEEEKIVPATRRKDQYLAIRFFALYLWKNDSSFNAYYSFKESYKNMDEFLSATMRYINNEDFAFSSGLYKIYFESLKKSNLIFSHLKLKKFTRSNSNVVNMNIFEVWMLLMTYFDISQIESQLDYFGNAYTKMIEDTQFVENILYLRDNKEKVEFRVNYVLVIKENAPSQKEGI